MASDQTTDGWLIAGLLALVASLPLAKALEAAHVHHQQKQAFCEGQRRQKAQTDEAALAKAGWIIRWNADCEGTDDAE